MCLFKQKVWFMSKKRFMFRWCLVGLVSFLMSMWILSETCVTHYDLAIDSSFSIVLKKINIGEYNERKVTCLIRPSIRQCLTSHQVHLHLQKICPSLRFRCKHDIKLDNALHKVQCTCVHISESVS